MTFEEIFVEIIPKSNIEPLFETGSILVALSALWSSFKDHFHLASPELVYYHKRVFQEIPNSEFVRF